MNSNKRILWLLPLLTISGCTTFGSNPKEVSYTVVEERAYQRGSYFKTSNGYFISNLTPAPLKIDGCDMPILTADLTAPRSDDGDIYITEVDFTCEGGKS